MGFIITWLTGKVGATFAKPMLFTVIAVLIAIIVFTLAKCTGGDNTAQQQATQTTRSGDAMANSASSAIGTVENRHDADATGDAAVAATQGNIDNAQNPDDLRGAVLNGVCRKTSHRNDPACKVR